MKTIARTLLALSLCMLTLFSLIPASARAEYGVTSGSCGPNATWKVDESTGTLTISGSGAMYDYEYMAPNGCSTAPWADYNYEITKISIGSGITHIGSFAFVGAYVSSVTIPAGVTSIGEGPFAWNNDMATISVASGNTAYLPISKSRLNSSEHGKYFFLRVEGDSMNKAGIHSGDAVLIRHSSKIKDGAIVAARWNGTGTLKRKHEEGIGDNLTIILSPESTSEHPTYRIPVSDFKNESAGYIGEAILRDTVSESKKSLLDIHDIDTNRIR